MTDLDPNQGPKKQSFEPANRITNYLDQGFLPLANSLDVIPVFRGETAEHLIQAELLAHKSELYQRIRTLLLNLLKHDYDFSIKESLHEALVELKDASTTSELITIAKTRTHNPKARESAILGLKGKGPLAERALGEILVNPSVALDYEDLPKSLTERREATRRMMLVAAEALEGATDPLALDMLKRGARTSIKDRLSTYLGNGPKEDITFRQIACADALKRAGDLKVKARLGKFVNSRINELRAIAYEYLLELKNAKSESIVLSKIDDAISVMSSEKIGEKLRDSPYPSTWHTLLYFLNTDNPSYHSVALTALKGPSSEIATLAISDLMDRTDKHSDVYGQCIAALAGTHSPKGEQRLLKHLDANRDDPDRLAQLIKALSHSQSEAVTKISFALFNSNHPKVREACVASLQKKSDPKVQRELLGRLELARVPQRRLEARYAAQALQGTNNSSTINYLLTLVNDPNEYVKSAAFKALELTSSPKVAYKMLAIATDKGVGNDQRRRALSVLATFRVNSEKEARIQTKIQKSVAPLLSDRANNNMLRSDIVSALKPPFHPAALVHMLSTALTSYESREVRDEALNNLQYSLPDFAQERIAQVLTLTTSTTYRKELISALYGATNFYSINTLIDVISEPEPSCREAALYCLIRFLREGPYDQSEGRAKY